MKILITGFHYSGTSILRKIIGNHKDVFDVIHEVNSEKRLKIRNSNKITVMKAPNLNNDILQICKKENNIKIICILRDPRDCFTSLKERFHNKYSFKKFRMEWLNCSKNSIEISNQKNGYMVKYEDLFKNNYKEIKNIFKWLGLMYEKSVILNNEKRKVPIGCDKVPQKKPARSKHALFRSYQINKPFVQSSENYIYKLSKDGINYFEDKDIKNIMIKLGYSQFIK